MSCAPRGPTRRLFFALWPSAAERQALAAATDGALAAADARAIQPANLHLTLAFLGDVGAARVDELTELGGSVARSWHAPTPLVLNFERLAYWRRPQILCALEREEGAVAASLAHALRSATSAAGFAPDLKPFHAHVTVARKVMRAAPGAAIKKVTWRSDAVALIASRTAAAGSVYSVVASLLLGKPKKVHEKH